jgi:hypothetical protein
MLSAQPRYDEFGQARFAPAAHLIFEQCFGYAAVVGTINNKFLSLRR